MRFKSAAVSIHQLCLPQSLMPLKCSSPCDRAHLLHPHHLPTVASAAAAKRKEGLPFIQDKTGQHTASALIQTVNAKHPAGSKAV